MKNEDKTQSLEERIAQLEMLLAASREELSSKLKENACELEKVTNELGKVTSELGKVTNELEEKTNELKDKTDELDKKKAELALTQEYVEKLMSHLSWLRRKIFGKMSEKRLPENPLQLSLFSPEEVVSMAATAPQEAADAEMARARAIKKTAKESVKKSPRKSLNLEGLPVVTKDIFPDGTTDENGKLKGEYEEIGTEVSQVMEMQPAKIYISRTVRHKVILKSDVKEKLPEDRKIIIAPLPLQPMAKGMAGASLLADIIMGKFMYHMPFYRQIAQYKELGVDISSSTIGDWYEAAIEQLNHLYKLLRQKIMSSEYIQIDESVIPVIDNEKHKAKKGYMWCVRDGVLGNVMFWYDRGSRANSVAREILYGYKGTIQCDGYEAYNQFELMNEITVCGCWAHARRKFFEALDENRQLADIGMDYICELYKIEAEIKEMSAEDKARVRTERSYKTIQKMEDWLRGVCQTASSKSRIGKAASYTLLLLPRLSRYVNNGLVNIDNNLIENAIRPLAIGRKNFLFCGNDAAAYRAAIAYSLISSCKAAGVDPRTWLEDVLCRIPYFKKDDKDMSELLPENWKKIYLESKVGHNM